MYEIKMRRNSKKFVLNKIKDIIKIIFSSTKQMLLRITNWIDYKSTTLRIQMYKEE